VARVPYGGQINWWTVWPWARDREQRLLKREVVVSVNQGSEHEQTCNGNGGRPGKGPQNRERRLGAPPHRCLERRVVTSHLGICCPPGMMLGNKSVQESVHQRQKIVFQNIIIMTSSFSFPTVGGRLILWVRAGTERLFPTASHTVCGSAYNLGK